MTSALNDASSVPHGIVSTALIAALALIEPRRLTVGRRVAYRTATAVASAWMAAASIRSADRSGTIPPVGRAALVAGAAGVAFGLAEAGEAVDARMHDGLVRAGARRPRHWIAAGEAGLALASWWMGRKVDGVDPNTPDEFDEATETLVPVPADIRELAAHLLAATDAYGAPELRAQLAAAQMIDYGDGDDASFWPGAQLDAPTDLPAAVPAQATFPVIGRFRALNDRTFEVRLVVENGALASVYVEEGSDWAPEALDEWNEADRSVGELGAWPAPGDIELLIETPAGYRPVAR